MVVGARPDMDAVRTSRLMDARHPLANHALEPEEVRLMRRVSMMPPTADPAYRVRQAEWRLLAHARWERERDALHAAQRRKMAEAPPLVRIAYNEPEKSRSWKLW